MSEAERGFVTSPAPPNELLLRHVSLLTGGGLEGELSRLAAEVRGFGLDGAVPIRPRRGILVGVRDLGGGLPEGDGFCDAERLSVVLPTSAASRAP